MGAPLSWLHPNLITSQRPCSLIPFHWEFRFQHWNFLVGWNTNMQSLMLTHCKTKISSYFTINFIPLWLSGAFLLSMVSFHHSWMPSNYYSFQMQLKKHLKLILTFPGIVNNFSVWQFYRFDRYFARHWYSLGHVHIDILKINTMSEIV